MHINLYCHINIKTHLILDVITLFPFYSTLWLIYLSVIAILVSCWCSLTIQRGMAFLADIRLRGHCGFTIISTCLLMPLSIIRISCQKSSRCDSIPFYITSHSHFIPIALRLDFFLVPDHLQTSVVNDTIMTLNTTNGQRYLTLCPTTTAKSQISIRFTPLLSITLAILR